MRLAAVGEFAGAVAHGIRNPLAGIRAAAQAARVDVDDGPAAHSLEVAINEADRLEQVGPEKRGPLWGVPVAVKDVIAMSRNVAIAKIAHGAGLPLVVDNTVGIGLVRPIDYGADILVVSLGVDTFEGDPISFFKLNSSPLSPALEVE